MSEDKPPPGGEDRKGFELSEACEARDGSAMFGSSEERLRAAVEKVRNLADELEREQRS